jgi:hypothetical protein
MFYKRVHPAKTLLGLPDLDQSRAAVLNSLGSLNSRRSYDHSIGKFIDWYCAEPRLGLNRSMVARYSSFLEQSRYAASTIKPRRGNLWVTASVSEPSR